MHKPDDGRPDFMAMSGGAGRMDGMPMKSMSGWDADEATHLKSSMMNRDKMVSLLYYCKLTYLPPSPIPLTSLPFFRLFLSPSPTR